MSAFGWGNGTPPKVASADPIRPLIANTPSYTLPEVDYILDLEFERVAVVDLDSPHDAIYDSTIG